MGKKGKRAKKAKLPRPEKTKEKRLEEMQSLKNQMSTQLGLTHISSPTIAKLYEIMDTFIEDGVTVSGNMDFPEAPFGGRTVHYMFTNNPTKLNQLVMPLKNPPKK